MEMPNMQWAYFQARQNAPAYYNRAKQRLQQRMEQQLEAKLPTPGTLRPSPAGVRTKSWVGPLGPIVLVPAPSDFLGRQG